MMMYYYWSSVFFYIYIYIKYRSRSTSEGFWIFILLLFDGSIISFASFWCIRSTSPTTYSVIGSLNKIPIALFGALFFENEISFWSIFAVMLTILGGLLYSIGPKEFRSQQEKIYNEQKATEV